MANALLFALLLICSSIAKLAFAQDYFPPDWLMDQPPTIEPARELDRLKEQLHTLERSLSEKDSVLQERDKAIESLQADLGKIENEQGGELEVNLKNAHMQLKDLEEKVSQLGSDLQEKELELQESKDRVAILEQTETEQVSTIKQLEKLVAEQKTFIGKAETALRAAEASMLKLQAEADLKERELIKAHGGWLPPWTSTRMLKLRSSIIGSWNKYADPLLISAKDKATKPVAAVQDWSSPHVETVRTHVQQKWNPVFKQSVDKVSSVFMPHVETVKSKVSDSYEASSAFLAPQMRKAQEFWVSYLQVAKETCSPYVDGVANHVRPHFERIQTVTSPYTEKAFQNYKSFLTSATVYHDQLQASVQERMKRFDFLAPLASKELIWFLASALLVFPVLAIFLFFSSALSSKKRVKTSKSHGGHGHRKPKRAKQTDK